MILVGLDIYIRFSKSYYIIILSIYIPHKFYELAQLITPQISNVFGYTSWA